MMAVTFEELITELQQQRAAILAELEEIAQRPRYTLGYGTHQADDASAAFDQAADQAIYQNAERLLGKIDRALARWEAGTYGVCRKCGAPIDHARLKAIPYAGQCIRCAENQDNR